MLPAVVRLARKEHMRAIESKLGRSLDGTRNGHNSYMRPSSDVEREPPVEPALRNEAIGVLSDMGVDCSLFAWPAHRTSVRLTLSGRRLGRGRMPLVEFFR